MRLSTRVVSGAISYPDLALIGADQTLNHYVLANSSKLLTKRHSIKFATQPIKAEFLRVKGQKMTIVAFPE
jgi:hypothetical protein